MLTSSWSFRAWFLAGRQDRRANSRESGITHKHTHKSDTIYISDMKKGRDLMNNHAKKLLGSRRKWSLYAKFQSCDIYSQLTCSGIHKSTHKTTQTTHNIGCAEYYCIFLFSSFSARTWTWTDNLFVSMLQNWMCFAGKLNFKDKPGYTWFNTRNGFCTNTRTNK